jgi:3-hydroxypropionyl-CoA synthetase (ADP-forming)
VLEQYGFHVPRGGVAASADEAVALAASVGYPVALKVASPDILHKTDVGGVELACDSEAKVRRAFLRIMDNVRNSAPTAFVEGVRIEEMGPAGVELFIGLHNDQQFGLTIMFGLGGILTEVLNDISFRVLPISRDDALTMIQEISGRRLLDGYRGSDPVNIDTVVELLMNASNMMAELGSSVDSVDFNPIVVSGTMHMVLDAKVVPRENKDVLTASPPPDTSYIEMFFKAKSIAVVGASRTPGKIGHAVLHSLSKHDYGGIVYPVNPGQEEILGLKSYPSLSAIPDSVDLVVVTVALELVPAILDECSSKGIHNMVIVSGGGKELGGEGRELEDDIARLARERAVRIVGCNCIGVFDGDTRLDTFFQVHERMTRPKKGPVSMITQSGTAGAAFLEAAGDVGVNKFVSYGNRIDVDEADLFAYLANDEDTKVIACYVEGLRDGRKFLAVAREVAERKPIVIYKAGRSRQAGRAAASHTGFFGGSYGVTAGAFRQAGLIVVDSFEELCAVAETLALQPRAKGFRAAMIGNGAGPMVQALDSAQDYGLRFDSLGSRTLATLRQVYPSFYQVQNPVDLTGSATSADYEAGISALQLDENVDIVMPWFVFQDTPLDEGIVDVLERLNEAGQKPIVCGATGGDYTRKISRMIKERGVPVHGSVREWVAAARGLAC